VSSPGPEQREYASLLLRKAGGDLRAATTLRDAGLDDELVGFHAQQAVEKAAKAVLVLAGVEIPRTHDLERVLTLAEQAGHRLPDPVSEAGWLTPWAVEYRYDEATAPLDQASAVSTAEAVVGWASRLRDALSG